MNPRILYSLFLVTLGMLVSFSCSFPSDQGERGFGGGKDAISSTTLSSTDSSDKPEVINNLRCMQPGNVFSPVNLFTASEDFLDTGSMGDGEDTGVSRSSWRKLMINRYYGVLRDRFYVRNTGGLITLQLEEGEATSSATILGLENDWKSEYVLAKINMFFSKDSHYGSQHAILEETYAFEMQFVHYRKDFPGLTDAVTEKHGILVLCVLFEATGKHNRHINPIAVAATTSAFPSKTFHPAHGPLNMKAIFPTDLSNFQYTGLYPLRPCAKEAKYVVFVNPLDISEKQLQQFREIRNSEGESTAGVFDEFRGNSQMPGVEVTVSKNVKLQVMKTNTLNAGNRATSLFGIFYVIPLHLQHIPFCFFGVSVRWKFE